MDVVNVIQDVKSRYIGKCFKEVVMLTCWTIRNHTNDTVFDNGVLSLVVWKKEFREAFTLVVHRVKPSLKDDYVSWLSSFS